MSKENQVAALKSWAVVQLIETMEMGNVDTFKPFKLELEIVYNGKNTKVTQGFRSITATEIDKQKEGE